MSERKQLSLRRFAMVAALVVGTLASIACSSDKKKTPTEPEIPDVPKVVENFFGTVAQKDIDCFKFSMVNNGTITFQIKDLKPLFSLTMGMGLGTPDAAEASGCAFFAEDDSVKALQLFSSPNQAAGTYCVCLFDVGNIFPGESVDYETQVEHPK